MIEDAKLLEGPIRTLRNVRDVKFVTREEAMEKYKANFDDTSIFDGIDAQVSVRPHHVELLCGPGLPSLRAHDGHRPG